MKPMLSFEDALSRLLLAAPAVSEIEEVPLHAAGGRVLAATLHSAINVPPCDNSAMDGYVVRAADAAVAGCRLPVEQRIPAGTVGQPLRAGTAARIFTGAPIPEGGDSVVMQEDCQETADGVQIAQPAILGRHIRRAGEDIHQGAEVLAAGSRLLPQHIGLAASVGLARLPVWRRLKVALISTGDELTPPGEPLKPGAIYDSNRVVLRTLLERLGCVVSDLGLVADRLEPTRAALRAAAADHDLILTSGGVSVGEEDHVKTALQAEGELDLWKIAIKPGKPLAFGSVRKAGGAATFIGLPGNPVAALTTFLMLVRPCVVKMQGAAQCEPRGMRLPAGFSWPKPDKRREFLRARLDENGQLSLFPNQGSAILSSAVWAEGLINLPPATVVTEGMPVLFYSFSDLLS
ncbi:MAG: gephyrin-like molybdotransferase Glp [Azonexus sp.]